MDDAGGWEYAARWKIGQEIKDWCRDPEHRITAEELAHMMHCGRKTVSRIWCGQKKLSDKEILFFVDLMGEERYGYAFFVPKPPSQEQGEPPDGVCMRGQPPVNENESGQPPSDPEVEAVRQQILEIQERQGALIDSVTDLRTMKILLEFWKGLENSSRVLTNGE